MPIVTSKHRTKSRPKMNWSEMSRFSKFRKLIQRYLPPSCSEMMGVLPATEFAHWLAVASLMLVCIKSGLSKPMLVHMLMGITLTNAPVSINPLTESCLLCTSSTCAARSASQPMWTASCSSKALCNSSYFDLLLSDVDPAYLIPCIRHVRLRIDV